MAEMIGSVWAIDIGVSSLKALRLSNESGALEVIGFEHIPHGKIITGTGVKPAEREELVALTLRQFVQQNDLSRDEIIISVPSQNSFSRFVKLPPVEKKRIPEIVKFEATQQIPFDINDVVWDWQLMSEGEAEEAKVGIFAIKNEIVEAELERFSRENLQVGYVQMSPMSLYNYVLYDRPELVRSEKQAVVVVNIGAENTDLVVCTSGTVWQRTIPMGGNAFTKAIADTFKLNFQKAEKLKRTAPMSKYARQILQAMKPVFADLASEIQRSLGYYTNSNPNTELVKVIAFGGGTKMRGLLQYLGQSLQISIERPDAFKRLRINSSVSAAKFHETVGDFGIVYGLGVQALGLGRITSNLLPRSIARSMAWASKTKYFVAASAVILLAAVLAFARTMIDRGSYRSKAVVRAEVGQLISRARMVESELQQEESKGQVYQSAIEKHFKVFENREVIPELYETILSTLPNEKNNPEQRGLYAAFKLGDVEEVKEVERKERKQVFITGMSVVYTEDLERAGFASLDVQRGSQLEREEEGIDTDDIERTMLEMLYGRGSRYSLMPTTRKEATDTGEGEEKRGFVVTIAGYTPYESIGELMDPAGAGDDKSRWGIITRLMHLDEVVDGNCMFELYKKTEIEHFELKTGQVSLTENIPSGVGVKAESGEVGAGVREQVLVDPMTREVISTVPAVDESGRRKLDRLGNPVEEVHDHWFILNAKFVWKVGPVAEETSEPNETSPASEVGV